MTQVIQQETTRPASNSMQQMAIRAAADAECSRSAARFGNGHLSRAVLFPRALNRAREHTLEQMSLRDTTQLAVRLH